MNDSTEFLLGQILEKQHAMDQRMEFIENELKSVREHISIYSTMIKGTKVVIYTIMAVATFRFGDIKDIISVFLK